MWGKKTEQGAAGIGGSYEEAAARVTAAREMEHAADATLGPAAGEQEADSLTIRPEWADAASRLCFLPAARLAHPAYALSDDEAEVISPKMQAFLQAVADKYAPAALARVANKYPEFTDLAAALGVLYWQKWRYVSKLRQMEAAERAEKEASAGGGPVAVDSVIPPSPLPVRPKVGERTADGALVI